MSHSNRNLILRYCSPRLLWRLLGKTGRKMVTRATSSLILAPIGWLSVWYGGLSLQIVTGALMATAALEWGSMAEEKQDLTSLSGILLSIASVISISIIGIWPQYVWVIVILATLLGMLVVRKKWPEMAFAGVYFVCPAPAFFLFREGAENGAIAATALFTTVIVVDVSAYCGGKLIGGPRLLPSISPAKTWAGAISGMIGAALTGASFALWSKGEVLHWVLAGLVIGLVAQVGDLLESVFKRRFGVKDSSNLVPGHGGVLDRIDSLIAASLFAAIILILAPDLIPQPGLF